MEMYRAHRHQPRNEPCRSMNLYLTYTAYRFSKKALCARPTKFSILLSWFVQKYWKRDAQGNQVHPISVSEAYIHHMFDLLPQQANSVMWRYTISDLTWTLEYGQGCWNSFRKISKIHCFNLGYIFLLKQVGLEYIRYETERGIHNQHCWPAVA